MLTRLSVLRSSLAFSLGRVKVHVGRRFYPLGLPPQIVDRVVGSALADLRKHGNWPELDQEIVTQSGGPSGLDQQIAASKSKPD
jgi:hypothetical protein